MSDAIRFENVWRRHGAKWVLRGFDFAAPRGQVTALLGRNGAGKSTSIRLLMGFSEPQAGCVRVLGEEAAKMGGAVRERIGYVPEDHPHLFGLKVGQLLAFEASTRSNFDVEQVTDRLAELGLGSKQRIGSMSRGMRAQVSIVVALATNPELLVLDDPGLGLDPIARREVLESVIDTLAERGTSVLFTSHVLSDVERLADRVVVLHKGVTYVDASLDALRTRLRRGFLEGADLDVAAIEQRAGVLAARRRRGGLEVFAEDDATFESLAQLGTLDVGPCPGLEDLFLGLLSGSRRAA